MWENDECRMTNEELLQSGEGLLGEFFRARFRGLGIQNGFEVEFGGFGVSEGFLGSAAIVLNVGVFGREGQRGVVGVQSLVCAAKEQQGVSTAILCFGGEGGFLGVIRRKAAFEGFEHELADLESGLDFR